MANHDGIKGIGGDRTFMDAYYFYVKLKEELNSNDNITEKEKTERDCCSYYMGAVIRCLSEIDSLPDGDVKRDYLDWLRWNNDIITTELESFKDIPHIHDLVPTISDCEKNVETVIQNYFQLTAEEKAVGNEYIHAYDQVKRSENKSGNAHKSALQHAGRLLINYVNYLKNRHYVNRLDRDDISFDQLQSDAEYLMEKLQGVNDKLAGDIKIAIEHFTEFCKLDDAAAHGQDIVIKDAVILAHMRATETALQSAIRHIKETISLIKETANRKTQEAWETTSLLFNPILHPIENLKNFGLAVTHPLETAKEIWKWAKENPWKCTTLIIGGILVGGLFVGTTVLLESVLIPINLPAVVLGGIQAVGATVSVIPTLQTAATGAKAAQVKNEAQQQISIQEAKEAELKAASENEGRRIAEEVLFNHDMRKSLRKKRKEKEEQRRKMKEQQRLIEAERKRQIDSMTPKQLRITESQLNKDQENLEEYLKETEVELQKHSDILLQIQKDASIVCEGRAAAVRLMQRVADNNPLTPESHLDNN